VVSSSEYGLEPLGSLKVEEFHDQLTTVSFSRINVLHVVSYTLRKHHNI